MLDNTFKICAGVTLFNPTSEEINNVIMYTDVFDKIFVYDNSVEKYNRSVLNHPLIDIISLGSNDGVGKACRIMTEKAKKECFDYIMLFDQDSTIDCDSIIHIIDFIRRQEVEATVYCPQIVFNEKTHVVQGGYKFVDWCITSGTVIKLKDYGENICFDDNYFIDRVDKDFCYQIVKNNKKICQINNAILYQQLGETSKKGYSIHKPFRHYYIARNRAYFNKKYKKSNFLTIFQSFRHICIIIKKEPDKLKKVKMVLRGISDYRKGKMGRLQENGCKDK